MTPADLVRRAIAQSAEREPEVRAMALLYGARVLAAVDQDAARQAFSEGVRVAERLPMDAQYLANVLEDAVRLGAMVDPIAAVALLRRLPSGADQLGRRSTGTMLVQSLAQSGDFETALELLEDPGLGTGGAQVIVRSTSDPALQRRAMLAARERWRAIRTRPDLPGSFGAQREFYDLFSQHWRKLDAREAETWLDEALLAIETEPGRGIRARFGGRVELHSMPDVHLFEILNVLRALKPPDQVEAILRGHPEVAAAAEIYPLGLESLAARAHPPVERDQRGAGHVGSGSGRPSASTLAAQRGDPSAVPLFLAEAHNLYQADTNKRQPNLAPRAFWPSCHAYKVAMYWAGKLSGMDAEPLLAGIADPDIALLAAIELAAGSLGLPQYYGLRMFTPTA